MSVTKGNRWHVWNRDDRACHYCGEEHAHVLFGTVDHVWPRSRGGSDALWNLVWSCGPCNRAWRSQVDKCGCSFCVTATRKHRGKLMESSA